MQSANLGILVRELLGCEIPDRAEEIRDILKAVGWKVTGAARLVAALWKKAVGGDVNAAKLIREMNGETGEYAAGGGLSGYGISGLMTAGGGYGTDGGCNGTDGAGAIGFNVSEMSDEALRAILDSTGTIAEETPYKTADNIRQDRTADEAFDFAGTSTSDFGGTSADDSAGKSVPASASAETRVNAAARVNAAVADTNEKNKKGTYVVPW